MKTEKKKGRKRNSEKRITELMLLGDYYTEPLDVKSLPADIRKSLKSA